MKLLYRNDKTAEFIASYYNKPLDKPDWYIFNEVSDDEAEIFLYDYIGWPYNEAYDFIQTLSGLKQKKIVIRINSQGGDVWDAQALFNAIASHPSKPITRIESIAASAASYIAIAGHERQAYKNTMLMIHEPMTGIFGNQYEFTDVADVLKQISDNMIDMYADHTKVGKRDIKQMLKEETWLNSKAMLEKGFIDTILETGKAAKAQFDLSIFSSLPEGIKNTDGGRELTPREVEKALRDAGASRSFAKALAAGRSEDPPVGGGGKELLAALQRTMQEL